MIERNSIYFKQAELLVRILPFIEEEKCFAVKEGTAINLFVRDLPRLSVDINLVYLPVQDRAVSLNGIDSALKIIAGRMESKIKGLQVTPSFLSGTGKIIKLMVLFGNVRVKVETSPVLRGTVYSPENLFVKDKVSELIGYAEARVASFQDLYAGKICAALDRQHPRDLFDIQYLLRNEGIDDKLFKAFLVYLISHNRPLSELLLPNFKDLSEVFSGEFKGMTVNDIELDELYAVRDELLSIIRKYMSESDKKFLISFKSGNPQWKLLGIDDVSEFPAVKWKLHNIRKMSSEKRDKARGRLEKLLRTGND